MSDDRDTWIRLFNRLEGAVSHHKRATAGFATDADEALYAARDRIMRDAAAPSEAEQAAPQYEWRACMGNAEHQRAWWNSRCFGTEEAATQSLITSHMPDGDDDGWIERRTAAGKWERVDAEQAAAEAAGPEPGLAAPSVAGYPGLIEPGPPNPEDPELDGDE